MNWPFFNKGRPRNVRGRRRMNMLETKIRTRSSSNKRAKRILVSWCIFLAALVVGWGAWKLVRVSGRGIFSSNPQFILRQIVIQNTGTVLSREEILQHARIRKGQNLFDVDLKAMRANLELLPEIKRVEIRRQMPDKMTISITERLPVARLAAPRDMRWETYAIDSEGFVMNLGGPGDSMPMITGAKISDLRVGGAVSSPEIFQALQLLQKCEMTTLNALVDVQSIDVSRSHMLVVETADGMRLKIGLQFMEQNLRRLEFILNDARNRGLRVATADLTVDRDVPVVFRRAA
jgi:cell division protein FtsQ